MKKPDLIVLIESIYKWMQKHVNILVIFLIALLFVLFVEVNRISNLTKRLNRSEKMIEASIDYIKILEKALPIDYFKTTIEPSNECVEYNYRAAILFGMECSHNLHGYNNFILNSIKNSNDISRNDSTLNLY